MNHFDKEMESINTDLIRMGALSERLVQDAIKALLSGDTSLARQVVARDRQVDNAENAISRTATRLLATNQPVAGDLRFLSTIFRLITDLERVADLSVNLAWRTVAINEEIGLKAPFSPLLPEMALMAQKMAAQVLAALARRDCESALLVCQSDNDLDELNHRHYREVVEIMQKRPDLVPWGVEAILAGNYLERMGDHITNLGEEIIYIVRGEVVRHQENMKYKKTPD
ncbi:MAG: phosphate signaling complex protein PhoU [Desulfarculales bacterium]|jgi:phosphate transport system protein|nr:phosphate signaling complex protein PhoU [Desulfarculales bacterium]